MKVSMVLSGAAVLALVVSGVVAAQTWPAKPLRLVVALPAGSGADMVARLVAPGLGERLGQPVVVENRPGAAENIGMEAVARSAPDGHTLLLAVTSLVTNPHLYRLSYDPIRDLVPVAQLARTHYVLVAHPSLPAKTVPEVLALAKARRGEVTCAHASGALHIACAWLKAAGGVDINLVPYKGSGQALNDVIGGHADLVFAVVHTVTPFANGNRLRILATTNPQRGSGPFGAVPTMAETLPGFELVSWLGVVAPAGVRPEIVGRLNREIAAVLDQPDVSKRVAEGGLEVAHDSPDAFGRVIQRDYAKFGEIIRRTGIQVE